jgi:hypothetical protein
MTVRIKIAAPNSLLLVMDKDSAEIPKSINGQLVIATPSCIAVGTLSGADGETAVTLSDDQSPIKGVENLKKVFSGTLATPGNVVHVCTVHLEPILTLPAQNERSRIEIWANSDTEPDTLCILILQNSDICAQA